VLLTVLVQRREAVCSGLLLGLICGPYLP